LTEVERAFSVVGSGVQLLPDFKEATVGSDGLWLTTASWQRLALHILENAAVELRVRFLRHFSYISFTHFLWLIYYILILLAQIFRLFANDIHTEWFI
jgi:hypothetical protein